MRQDAIHELPAGLTQLFFSLGIPKEVLAILADGNVGVHATAVHAHDGFGEKARSEAHVRGYLPADQFVELNLIGSRDNLTVAVIDFKLRGCNFRVVLLILEAHSALYFRRRVDESAQRIAR